ncbi:MAG: hypothetical protein CM1200mP38_2020 [Dehalococcoidia bacterium]|nr:MAG: hypothetical protein CM1200mP38_2020 [Dehalococcoidia bacterium]
MVVEPVSQQPNSEYTASDIQVLRGMEAVRRRPGMYMGVQISVVSSSDL